MVPSSSAISLAFVLALSPSRRMNEGMQRLRHLTGRHFSRRRIVYVERRQKDFGAVRNHVERAAAATFVSWRGISQIDHIALAEAGTREDFDDLEFLINRGFGELNR